MSRAQSVLMFPLLLAISLAPSRGATNADPRVNGLLEPICQKYNLPALAGAIVTSKGLVSVGAVGVRKRGTIEPVTVDDQWHLGSDTKAMTAVMIASLVERGKLSWSTSIEQVFPRLAPSLPVQLRKVTLTQLLCHRAGLPRDANWQELSLMGSLHHQRIAALRSISPDALLSEPGTEFHYSNAGFVIAAAMAEEVTHETSENLISDIVFKPLKMVHTGFGGTGTSGRIDQPWPHLPNGEPMPQNGPSVDNPPIVGPAGTVHCSLADWAQFIADQLRGLNGEPALLRAETYRHLHDPPFGGDYAFGWGVVQRSWGGGTVYTHAGSNTMNMAVVWMAPKRDFAVLVCCNEGGADKACDEAAYGLIQLHLHQK